MYTSSSPSEHIKFTHHRVFTSHPENSRLMTQCVSPVWFRIVFWQECRKFQPIFVGSSLCIYAVPLYKVLFLPHAHSVCVWFIIEPSNNVPRCDDVEFYILTTFCSFSKLNEKLKIRRCERNVFMLFCWITRVTVAECAMKWLIISQRNIIRPSLVADRRKRVWIELQLKECGDKWTRRLDNALNLTTSVKVHVFADWCFIEISIKVVKIAAAIDFALEMSAIWQDALILLTFFSSPFEKKNCSEKATAKSCKFAMNSQS